MKPTNDTALELSHSYKCMFTAEVSRNLSGGVRDQDVDKVRLVITQHTDSASVSMENKKECSRCCLPVIYVSGCFYHENEKETST